MDYDVPLPVKLPKKERNLPVQKEFEYNPVNSYRDGNPYTMAFCYPHPLYHKPFVVKGGYKDCNGYLETLNYPVFAHLVFFYKGTTRRIFKFYRMDKNLRLYDSSHKKGKKKWELLLKTEHSLLEYKTLAEFKRVPRRWIRELNLYVNTKRRRFHDI